jgi:hypothetical protein
LIEELFQTLDRISSTTNLAQDYLGQDANPLLADLYGLGACRRLGTLQLRIATRSKIVPVITVSTTESLQSILT